MKIFIFVLLFLIERFSFRIFNSQINNNYINYQNSIRTSYFDKVAICIQNYKIDSNSLSLGKCLINESKNDVEGLIGLLKNESIYDDIKTFLPENETIKDIFNILKESAKINGTLIKYINETLFYKDDNSSLTIFDYIDNILDNLNSTPINYINIIGNASKILAIEGVINASYYLLEHNESVLFGIIHMLTEKLDKEEVLNAVEIILKNKGKEIQTFLKNVKAKSLIKKFLEKQSNLLSLLINIFLDKEKVLELFFELPNYEDAIGKVINFYRNINNTAYINENLIPFLCDVLLTSADTGRKIREIFLNDYQKDLWQFFLDKDIRKYGLSPSCIELFKKTFLEDIETKEYTLKYLKKFIFDSPMNKGDFLSFDNCLEVINNSFTYKFNYTIKPVFIIGLFDCKNKMDYVTTTFFEKYYYISNFCFPNGFREDNSALCNEEDYSKILRFFKNLLYSNSNDTNIKAIMLTKDNIKLESQDYLIGIFSLIILAIPIIIKISLIISKCIIEKKNNKEQNINKLINDKSPYKISMKNENELKPKKKSNLSKCHILLNNCFDFYKNGAELFNFNLNNTNFNNINGITYIKGLIGLSIILNVFGLTFTNLMNAHTKDYGIWHFYRTNQSIMLLILLIGYRYSSRILFSCSGYTLVYKYLCFIEQDKGLYFLKFIFLQSYKYLLLILILIMFKFSVIRIIYLFRTEHRPVWELFRNFLEKENFLLTAFAFLLDLKDYNSEDKKQNIVFNFFMPICEIMFFILGTTIISIGYKFKLRIDLFLIIFAVCFFIIKIIICSIGDENNHSFSTIDYYSFNFGMVALSPLYNIPYYIIGMYFGLINYSIQKGITNIYKENQYKKYYQLEESNKKNDENEENSLMSPININEENKNDNQKNDETENKNKIKDENLDKYLSTKENNFDNNITNKQENELVDQVKNMPFLKSPIQFYNLNKKYKDHICYNILIFLAVSIMIILCYTRNIFIYGCSQIKDFENTKLTRTEYRDNISMEKVINNIGLNAFNILDTDIVVFLSQWLIFLLFFKEGNLIREFCNSTYWSFFVKSYYSYVLVSVPIILCIIHESESSFKLHMYNFLLLSLINILYIFAFLILFYSVFELPVKKLFKGLLKRNEIVDEEEEDENDDEDEKEKEKENEQNMLFDGDDDDEIRSLK